jgi:hypothetical protein
MRGLLLRLSVCCGAGARLFYTRTSIVQETLIPQPQQQNRRFRLQFATSKVILDSLLRKPCASTTVP